MAGRPLVTVPEVAVGAADGAGNVAGRSYEVDATEKVAGEPPSPSPVRGGGLGEGRVSVARGPGAGGSAAVRTFAARVSSLRAASAFAPATAATMAFCGAAATMYSSMRLRVRASREPAEVPPITTDTICLLSRRTDATRLKPDACV